MTYLVNHLLIDARKKKKKGRAFDDIWNVSAHPHVFFRSSGTQLGAIRVWKKSLGSVQPADPAAPFHFPNTVVCDSGSKTPKLVRYRHHWKTDPLWIGRGGTGARWIRSAAETLQVGVAFIHQSRNSARAVSFGTHLHAQSFSLGPFSRTVSGCVRTGLWGSGSMSSL